jgi:cellulose synthase/poly-beta-1,6-N-acetylglucosamine synthase-like glycosyltransferase
MSQARVGARSLAVPLAASGVLAVAAWLALSRGIAIDQRLYVIANSLLILDAVDLLARSWMRARLSRRPGGRRQVSVPLDVGRFTPWQVSLHLRPYAMLASVHDAGDDLEDFLEAMAPHRDRLWVIDDASRDDTWFRLERSGVHCYRNGENRKKPGALRELLRHLPAEIETVLVLDPDVRFHDSRERGLSTLERVIFEFQRSGRAAVTPRVTARDDGWLERLQGFEYALACEVGRHSLGDRAITSGVALYRRDALEAALGSHSLSVYAEDLENALILLSRGESIYYDGRFAIETVARHTWKSLLSQRVGWAYGLARVYFENFASLRACVAGRPFVAYQLYGYLGVFGLLLHPVRVASLLLLALSTFGGLQQLFGVDVLPALLAPDPAYFLLAYVKYTIFALLAAALLDGGLRRRREFLPVLPLYFFYALWQVVPTTLGYANWASLRLAGRRVYRDHYQHDDAEVGKRIDGRPD